MAVKRIAGTCFVKLDGGQLALMGGLTIQPNNTSKAMRAGMDGIHGSVETQIVPSIEVEVTKNPQLRLTDLPRVVDSTVTAECADGTVYVLRNAIFAGEAQMDGGEGKVKLRFEGVACNEI